jgi:DNA-binding transcriptional MocR family regulator
MKNKRLARYRQVALEVEKLIRSRAYEPGERIPSVREMCERSGSSITTILNAYIFLERMGLVEARPQSGFFVRTAASSRKTEPRPLAAMESIEDLIVSGFINTIINPDFVQLSELIPSADLLPAKVLLKITSQISLRGDALALQFDDPRGNWDLRRQIARHLSAEGTSILPNEVLVTTGEMESWNVCLRTLGRPGATVLVQPSLYFGMLEVIRSMGMVAKELPCLSDGRLDLTGLGNLLRQETPAACILMPNFSSPKGPLLSDDTKEQLVNLLSERNIPLIEDDVYGELQLTSSRSRTLKEFDKRGLVIFCSSFAKTLSPGFRVAWVAAGQFHDALLRNRFFVSIAAPSLSQRVLAQYLTRGYYVRHLRFMRQQLKKRCRLYRECLLHYFPPGTEVEKPSSGHALWVTPPNVCDTTLLAKLALERKILLIPGTVLSASGSFGNSFRLSFMGPFTPDAEKAIETLGRLVLQCNPSHPQIVTQKCPRTVPGLLNSAR